MRWFLVLATGLILGNFHPALVQEKPASLPQERFLGEWINVDRLVFTARRLVEERKSLVRGKLCAHDHGGERICEGS